MSVPNFYQIHGVEQSNDEYASKWQATGFNSTWDVRTNALLVVPEDVDIATGKLYRQDIQISELGFQLHEITVPYGRRNKTTGEFTFAFDTTGGSFHITHSKSSVAKYPEDAVDYKQAINVVKDGAELKVEGSDLIIPALKLTYTSRQPNGFLTESVARDLARMTGKVNSATFRGFAAGEVLFLGATGSDGTEAEAELQLHFAAEENLTDLVIGAITDIEKQGHDLLWVMWKDATDSGKPTKEPLAVYIERMYDRYDFAAYFGF